MMGRGGRSALATALAAAVLQLLCCTAAAKEQGLCPPSPETSKQRVLLTSSGLVSDPVGSAFKESMEALGAGAEVTTTMVFICDAQMNPWSDGTKSYINWEYEKAKKWFPGTPKFVELWLHFDESEYKFDEEKATKVMNEAKAVWLIGGNTYFLAATMKKRQAWWDKTVTPRVRDGSLLIGGQSAGSIMAGRDMSSNFDSPAPPGEWWDLHGDTAGLSLVNCTLRPHYEPKSEIDAKIDNYRRNRMPKGPCPGCTILRFQDTTALWWPGNGSSDVIYLHPPELSLPEPLVGTLPETATTEEPTEEPPPTRAPPPEVGPWPIIMGVAASVLLVVAMVVGTCYWQREHGRAPLLQSTDTSQVELSEV